MLPRRGKKIDDGKGGSAKGGSGKGGSSNNSRSKLEISSSSSLSMRGLPGPDEKNSHVGLPSATQSHDAQLDRAPAMLARACAPHHKSDHQSLGYQPNPPPPRSHKPEPGAEPARTGSQNKMRTPDPNQEIISAERFIQGKPIPYKSSDLSGPFASSSQPDEYLPSVDKKPKHRGIIRCAASPPSVRRPSLVDLPQIPIQPARPDSKAMERPREQAPSHTMASLTNLQKSKVRRKSIPTEDERNAYRATEDERKSKLVARGQRISPTEDGRHSKIAAEGRRMSITEFDPRTERRGSLPADCEPRMSKVTEYEHNMAKPASYSRHGARPAETHRSSLPYDERRRNSKPESERRNTPPTGSEQGRRKSIPIVLPMKQTNIVYAPAPVGSPGTSTYSSRRSQELHHWKNHGATGLEEDTLPSITPSKTSVHGGPTKTAWDSNSPRPASATTLPQLPGAERKTPAPAGPALTPAPPSRSGKAPSRNGRITPPSSSHGRRPRL